MSSTAVVVKSDEKVKVKKSLKIPQFEEMTLDSTDLSKNAVILKTPMKRKMSEKIEGSESKKFEFPTDTPAGETQPDNKKMDWLREKAKSATIPDEKVAVIKPKFLYKESGPLVIHLCNQCKTFNSNRSPQTIAVGMVQMPLAMCTVCRFHFNQARNLRFFQHELPALKKQYNL
ncbi:hypothetical protein CAEBREN_02707 [Caenorhabditis brenneri]|uniref:Uncharacterized protein n=1 Tax=Caenorhabditis brenneri TaxID=135651 RepID=G0NJF1_CAEBE|nr:hypothetical protein CAEBREN_02707 [Caenorhabditis brenneri]